MIDSVTKIRIIYKMIVKGLSYKSLFTEGWVHVPVVEYLPNSALGFMSGSTKKEQKTKKDSLVVIL